MGPQGQRAKKNAKGFIKGKGNKSRHHSGPNGGKILKPHVKGNIKKKIRDVERLMNKPGLPEEAKAAQQARLAGLHVELEAIKQVALEKKMAVRYHKVRFFERVKLERRATQLQRIISQAKEQHTPVEPEVHSELAQVERDLLYNRNFPRGHKYVALLVDAETPEAQAHLDSERARLRALVERRTAEAAILADGDEGRSLGTKGKSSKDKFSKTAGAKENEAEKDDFFLQEEEGGSDAGSESSGEASSSSDDDDAEPADEAAPSKSPPVAGSRQGQKRPATGQAQRGQQAHKPPPRPHRGGEATGRIDSKDDRKAQRKAIAKAAKHTNAERKRLKKEPKRARAEGGRKRQKKGKD